MEKKQIICSSVYRKNFNDTGDYQKMETESAVLTSQLSVDMAGHISLQQLDIVADVEIATAETLQRMPQQFKLTTDKGETIYWGDATHKARCSGCSREGLKTSMTFNRKSTAFEF